MRSSSLTLFATIALCLLIIYIRLPREWSETLSLLTSRVTRRISGGPAPLHLPAYESSPLSSLSCSVWLTASYSLEDHKNNIGRAEDLEQALRDAYTFQDPLWGDHIVYGMKTGDESLMAAIRNDIGVVVVTCLGKIHLRVQRPGGDGFDHDARAAG